MAHQDRINKKYLKAVARNDVALAKDLLENTRYGWWDNATLSPAQLMACDRAGNTALMIAADHGHTAMVDFLLAQRDFQRHATNKGGISALHLAAGRGQIDLIQKLIDSGLDVNQSNNEGLTPLHYAVQSGNAAAVELLVAHGAEINKVDNKGRTPFFHAVVWSKGNVLPTMTQLGANPDLQDSEGKTPMTYAVKNGSDSYPNRTNVQAIITAGGNPHVKDASGFQPVSVGYVKKFYEAHIKEMGEQPTAVVQPAIVVRPVAIAAPARPAATANTETTPDSLTQAFINEGLDPSKDEQWRTIGNSVIEHVIGSPDNPRVITTTFNFAARQTIAQTRNMLTGEVVTVAPAAMDEHANPSYIEQAHAELVKAGKTPPVLWPNGAPAGSKKLKIQGT